MDIAGRLIKILPEVRGESQRGPWVRGGFVIETDDTFPRQVAFTLFGEDRLAMLATLQMNSPVIVTFSPESREYNERWYTDLRCIRVVPAGAMVPPPWLQLPHLLLPQRPHPLLRSPLRHPKERTIFLSKQSILCYRKYGIDETWRQQYTLPPCFFC